MHVPHACPSCMSIMHVPYACPLSIFLCMSLMHFRLCTCSWVSRLSARGSSARCCGRPPRRNRPHRRSWPRPFLRPFLCSAGGPRPAGLSRCQLGGVRWSTEMTQPGLLHLRAISLAVPRRGLHRVPAAGAVRAAVGGSSATLLHPYLPSVSVFNRDGEGVAAK